MRAPNGQASLAVLASLAAGGLGALLATQAQAKDTVQLVAAVVVVLALAGVGLLQLVQKFKGGREGSQWQGEMTTTVGQLVKTTSEMTAYLSRLRHELLVPCHSMLTDLGNRAEGIEHVIHDFPGVKSQVAELHLDMEADRRAKGFRGPPG